MPLPPEPRIPTVEEEIRRNPELKEEDLQHLRDWNSKQPHLPKIPDNYLISFLHSCYFSLERAKKTAEAFFTIRTHAPEFFSHRDPLLPDFKFTWDVVDIAILPERDPGGNVVVLNRFANTDPAKYIVGDAVKVFFMCMDAVLNEGTQPGFRFIYDLSGLSIGHVYRMNITILRKYMVFVQEAMRIRMKSVHIVNHNPILDKLLALILPLMKQELVKQLILHPTMEDLYKTIPQRILPSDYGGEAGSVSSLKEDLRKLTESFRDWFLEDEKLKVDETIRGGKTVSAADLFGMEGSFKKLDID